jgi:hypothetical protein
MIPRSKWKYKGLPGHFCAVGRCRFRLCTDIGEYRISTVGAMYDNDSSKEMSEIGLDRHYETYVFKLDNTGNILDFSEIDGDGIKKKKKDDPYECDKKAEIMHNEFCLKYAKLQ